MTKEAVFTETWEGIGLSLEAASFSRLDEGAKTEDEVDEGTGLMAFVGRLVEDDEF